MNVRSEMLRPQGGMHQLQPTLNSHQFLPTQQPGMQQPQQPPNGILPNPNNINPSMSLLGGQPNNARLNLQVHQRRLLEQSHHAQAMNASANGGPPGPHMVGPSNQPQGIAFANGMMQQPGGNPPLRRVASQPTPLNQQGGHLSGMHPGPPNAMGGMSMGMNPQTSMPAQIRQAQQMTMRMQQHQQQQQQQMQRMPPEMAMSLARGGNPGLPQNNPRSNSAQAQAQAQLMGSLSQPPTLAQAHNGGMQPSLPQSNFPNSIPIPHQHQQSQISSSPRPSGHHSQTHTPTNLNMSTPVLPQGTANRSQMTPENGMFMGFPQNQMANFNQGRISNNNSQFPPFVPSVPPSSTPPGQHGDMPDGLTNLPSSAARPNFLPTPAQQVEQMHPSGEGYGPRYNMPPPHPNIPRPPSHNNHHPPVPLTQQHHHSPHASDHINHPQRPQSQPQGQPGRPPSQGGSSNTPRSLQPQLPSSSGLLPAARIPPTQPPHNGLHPSQLQSSPAAMSIAHRPQTLPAPGSLPPSGQPSEGVSPHTPAIPQRVTLPIGVGQAVLRVLQFSALLANKDKNKLQLSYWRERVDEYFTPKAIMKFTLWKDNQRNEAKPFEIGVPILPRFFLVTSQAGVESMTLALDGARERLINGSHAMVECVAAVWTFNYSNGYKVTLRGPLTAHVLVFPSQPGANNPPFSPYTFKFENLQFDANLHDKYIALESIMGQRTMEDTPKTPRIRNTPTPTVNGTAAQQRAEEDKKWEEPRVNIERASIPGEPVNAFGIPQATMRCLELAESVSQMADLISFSNEQKLGPIEALSKFASKIRTSHVPGQPIVGEHSGNPFPFPSVVSSSPSVTLYSTAPPSTNPSNPPSAPTSSPQNAPLSAENSPQKQNKSAPSQMLASSSSTTAPPPTSSSASTSSATHTTPSMSNASLKRKQGSENASPPIANAEQPPPPKRMTTRKTRGRTTG